MKKIVVGVDGSPASVEALKWAVGEARLRNAEVLAVQSWQFTPMVEPLGPTGDNLFEDIRQAAADSLDEAVASVDTGGVHVTKKVVEGRASESILDAAEGAELLVVGSRGRGGFSGLLLGSVSQQCAHHARCPIVIVRARPDTATS